MKRSHALLVLFAAAGLLTLASSMHAAECPGDVELKTISLNGKVASEEREFADKDGSVRTVVVYYLQTDDGRIQLPDHSSSKKDADPEADLANYVGDRVALTAKGYTKSGKDGSTSTHIHKIVSIERVDSSST